MAMLNNQMVILKSTYSPILGVVSLNPPNIPWPIETMIGELLTFDGWHMLTPHKLAGEIPMILTLDGFIAG